MSDVKTAPAKAAINPAELLALHLAAEDIVTPFSYKKPDGAAMNKRASVALCRTDLFRSEMMVMKKGTGETNLHYHHNADGFWMVVKGRVRFYGPDDVIIGEFGPNEGTSMPRYARYWFENIGEEDLEMLHIFATPQPGDHKSGRTDAVERPAHWPKVGGGSTTRFDAAIKR